ncbi:hypothetical protein [Brucella intermedia]|uniref:hypothetical protein n=1 Tax=Brucella intermedia TaxID=94625 RepID=UPI00236216EE|nr:hypothetical protein [Brucella intermedia]
MIIPPFAVRCGGPAPQEFVSWHEKPLVSRNIRQRDIQRLALHIRRQLDEMRVKTIIDETERAIANTETKRLMSRLSGKFNLISQLEQSIG